MCAQASEAALECRRAAKAAADEKGEEWTEQVEDDVTDAAPPEEAAPEDE